MTPTASPSLTLEDLSDMPRAEFTACLGDIFEHSPWIAEQAWEARPFADVQALHSAMLAAVEAAGPQRQLALIAAHPELAGKEAARGTLTHDSTQEQRGAGLDQCSAEELQRLRGLNAAYRERLGFPFVIAVKGLDRYQIMAAMEERLQRDRDTELRACLREIGKIARLRLQARFSQETTR